MGCDSVGMQRAGTQGVHSDGAALPTVSFPSRMGLTAPDAPLSVIPLPPASALSPCPPQAGGPAGGAGALRALPLQGQVADGQGAGAVRDGRGDRGRRRALQLFRERCDGAAADVRGHLCGRQRVVRARPLLFCTHFTFCNRITCVRIRMRGYRPLGLGFEDLAPAVDKNTPRALPTKRIEKHQSTSCSPRCVLRNSSIKWRREIRPHPERSGRIHAAACCAVWWPAVSLNAAASPAPNAADRQ